LNIADLTFAIISLHSSAHFDLGTLDEMNGRWLNSPSLPSTRHEPSSSTGLEDATEPLVGAAELGFCEETGLVFRLVVTVTFPEPALDTTVVLELDADCSSFAATASGTSPSPHPVVNEHKNSAKTAEKKLIKPFLTLQSTLQSTL